MRAHTAICIYIILFLGLCRVFVTGENGISKEHHFDDKAFEQKIIMESNRQSAKFGVISIERCIKKSLKLL